MQYTEVLFGFIAYASLAVVVVFALYFVYRKRKLLSEEIRLAIEKGQPYEIPKREVNYYLHGILWTMVGVIAFIALLFTVPDIGIAILGLLPAAVGAAFLAYHRKVAREKKETPA